MSLTQRIYEWSKRKVITERLHKFGGIQGCPYCEQVMQMHGNWSIKTWDRDPFIDVITCGPCGGKSLWRFEMGMIYIGPLTPPQAKGTPAPYYDIKLARLK